MQRHGTSSYRDRTLRCSKCVHAINFYQPSTTPVPCQSHLLSPTRAVRWWRPHGVWAMVGMCLGVSARGHGWS